MKIMNPRGEAAQGGKRALPTVPSARGLRLAILTNHWKSMDRMAERFRTRARELHGASAVEILDIPINGPMSAAVEERVVGDSDFAIVGLAN
jgi:hypothetical protein